MADRAIQLTPEGSDPSRGQAGTGGCRLGLTSPAHTKSKPRANSARIRRPGDKWPGDSDCSQVSHARRIQLRTRGPTPLKTGHFLTLAWPPRLLPSLRWGKQRAQAGKAAAGEPEPGAQRPEPGAGQGLGRRSLGAAGPRSLKFLFNFIVAIPPIGQRVYPGH